MVVMVTFSMPGMDFNSFTSWQQSLRTRGSPPVTLIRLMPRPAAQMAMASISSRDRISQRARLSTPSGMQYLHRRLHRSVMDILI